MSHPLGFVPTSALPPPKPSEGNDKRHLGGRFEIVWPPVGNDECYLGRKGWGWYCFRSATMGLGSVVL